jgi:hypothetical protein
MLVDVSGIWSGTVDTDGLTYLQGMAGGGDGWGGPPRTYPVALWISQGEYKNFGYGRWPPSSPANWTDLHTIRFPSVVL